MRRQAPNLTILCIILAWTTVFATEAAGQDEIKAISPVPEASSEQPPESTFRPIFQAGLFYRINDRPGGEQDLGLMMTMELGGCRWDGVSPTWGLAARGVVDDIAYRLGPKAFGRIPLGKNKKSFIQVGLTYYVFSADGNLADSSNWSAEIEFAANAWFSLVLARESLRIKTRDYFDFTRNEDTWKETTDVGWYAGAKVGGWRGLIFTGVIFLLGAAAAGGG